MNDQKLQTMKKIIVALCLKREYMLKQALSQWKLHRQDKTEELEYKNEILKQVIN